MLKRALIAVAVLAIAAPGYAFAKGAKRDDTAANLEPSAPVPYSDLASWDAKVNGHEKEGTHHRHHRKASKDEAQAGSAEAGSSK